MSQLYVYVHLIHNTRYVYIRYVNILRYFSIFFEKLEQKVKTKVDIKALLNYKQFTLKKEKEVGKYKKKNLTL